MGQRGLETCPLEGGCWTEVQAWGRIWTIILSSSILPLMTWYGFPPLVPRGEEKEGPSVCVVSLRMRVLTWVWVWVCPGRLSLSVGVKNPPFDGRSRKVWSHSRTSSRWGSESTQRRGRSWCGGGRGEATRLISTLFVPPFLPPVPPPRAWGVWSWVGARDLDASLWTPRWGRGHLACLHNGIISVPASATAAASTSCHSASTSCPWRGGTNCPPSKWVLKHIEPLVAMCLWAVFLGIAQCVCWLLCAELQSTSVGLNHRNGRYICVSTPLESQEPDELRSPGPDKVTEFKQYCANELQALKAYGPFYFCSVRAC